MSTLDPFAQETAPETVALTRAEEDKAREAFKEFSSIWGDGPPYFSTATAQFWTELSKGHFHLSKCTSCSHVYFPPRVICSQCWAEDAGTLEKTRGLGTLFSFTDLHVTAPALAELAPLKLAIIDLEEGVRVLTWLRGPGADTADVGVRCKIVVEDIIGRKWFVAQLA